MKEQADKGKGQPSPKGKGKAKSRGKGKSAKSRDDAAVRQLEQFGWICVVGHEEAEAEEPQAAEPVAVDPPEADEDPAAEIERLSAKTGWEKTQDGDPVLVKRGRTGSKRPRRGSRATNSGPLGSDVEVNGSSVKTEWNGVILKIPRVLSWTWETVWSLCSTR